VIAVGTGRDLSVEYARNENPEKINQENRIPENHIAENHIPEKINPIDPFCKRALND
jgi:hypothetical protein